MFLINFLRHWIFNKFFKVSKFFKSHFSKSQNFKFATFHFPIIETLCLLPFYKYNLKIDNFHTSDRIFLERFAKIFVCSLIMGSLLYYQFFYFEDYFNRRDLIKVLYLFFIVGNSIFVYFIMSVLFKAFSIKDFKLKNYK